jgi:hypothetical protein
MSRAAAKRESESRCDWIKSVRCLSVCRLGRLLFFIEPGMSHNTSFATSSAHFFLVHFAFFFGETEFCAEYCHL